jgi:hypothetical protein
LGEGKGLPLLEGVKKRELFSLLEQHFQKKAILGDLL